MMRTIALAALVLAASGAPRGPAAPEDIEIVAMDYAFKLPAELPAGRAAFRLRNAGKVRHELNISLLKPGVTPQQVLAAMNASQSMTPLLEAGVGVLFANAGERSSAAVSTELIPGRSYFVRCIFRDSASKPKHENMGMFGVIRVGATKTLAQATTPIDTIVGTDYAFQYRRTVAPGPRRFAFVNAGKQRHEFSIQLLKAGVTAAQVAKADSKGEDVRKFFDGSFGLVHAPAGQKPIGVVEVDLLPGREYLIECGFSDTEKSPPHYMLGMTGSIQVAAK